MRYGKSIVALTIVGALAGGLLVLSGLGDVHDSMVARVVTAWQSSGIFFAGDIEEETAADPAHPGLGYIKYENERFGFTLYHRGSETITEYARLHGARLYVLEDARLVRGLQIYVLPYSEDTISDERFHMDVPSGVRENVEYITLGEERIPAVYFTSRDIYLGETREVWFIYNGYLYEVTTLKSADEWLAPILQSWRFIEKS